MFGKSNTLKTVTYSTVQLKFTEILCKARGNVPSLAISKVIPTDKDTPTRHCVWPWTIK